MQCFFQAQKAEAKHAAIFCLDVCTCSISMSVHVVLVCLFTPDLPLKGVGSNLGDVQKKKF
jgi:hypothetical protein